MKNLHSLGIRFKDGELYILDQQLLPHNEDLILVKDVDHMVAIIQMLKVRGAPAIGISAGLALAQFSKGIDDRDKVRQLALTLRASRPTAVNLMVVIDRMLVHLEKENFHQFFEEEAVRAFEEDVELCDKMAEYGAELVQDGDGILTHCNTGRLVTAGVGTALGVIFKAHEQGKKIHVYVDETRPLLQGGRLTAWELEQAGIPYSIITDSMAAHMMKTGKIQKIFVGSDRVALNGDFANKIGTYSLSVLAKYHNIPFYPVAPYTTIDFECETGDGIPIEEREAYEVRGVRGSFGDVCWAPVNAPVCNPAFDVSPVDNVTALICDKGVFTQEMLKNGVLKSL
ncbi:MAG: S-methyl-5-thioribose-1-phosphate isomerase [Gammaproteobacteria bacterium]|nr:S-methyl-5-thioribose-1-phosphate isomerase [Gammaproteobacteria bacterium]